MPIRIKPVHDLGPCVLDLDSIKGICALVDQHFNHSRYSAEDGVWEVYNENTEGFIFAISNHETLDAFLIDAQHVIQTTIEISGLIEAVMPEETEKVISIVFNKYQATVKFSGPQEKVHWFEHFLIDLKKHLHSPQLRQRLIVERDEGDYEPLALPKGVMIGFSGIFGGLVSSVLALAMKSGSAPYCRIVLHKRQQDPFIENIKANLVSNVIWIIIAFVGWLAFGVLFYWVYRTYGINMNELIVPPTIPTSTPIP